MVSVPSQAGDKSICLVPAVTALQMCWPGCLMFDMVFVSRARMAGPPSHGPVTRHHSAKPRITHSICHSNKEHSTIFIKTSTQLN